MQFILQLLFILARHFLTIFGTWLVVKGYATQPDASDLITKGIAILPGLIAILSGLLWSIVKRKLHISTVQELIDKINELCNRPQQKP
jgi:hypothetical protein